MKTIIQLFILPALMASFIITPATANALSMNSVPAEFQADLEPFQAISEMPAQSVSVEIPADVQQASNDEVQAQPAFLKIIGRGLENRKTGEVIAIACVGEKINGTEEPSCKRLRHVKVKRGSTDVTFLGNTYWVQTDHEPTADEIQASVKSINKAFRTFKKNDPKEVERRFTILGYSLACGILCGIFGLGFATHGAIFTAAFGIGLTAGGFLLAPVLLIMLSPKPLMGKTGMISNVMADQNGWNWSNEPRKISAKAYAWYMRYLSNSDGDQKL